MLEEQQPVKLCGYWQVQSVTKLAYMSKETCQFLALKPGVPTAPNLLKSNC